MVRFAFGYTDQTEKDHKHWRQWQRAEELKRRVQDTKKNYCYEYKPQYL
jgi:hypothetical protein